MGAQQINETINEPWKCTGGLEYGGFHPEVINHEDHCQLCNRNRNELIPVVNKKKKASREKNENGEKTSFLKKYVLSHLSRLKYGLVALIASALGLNNGVIQDHIKNIGDQFLTVSSQVTPEDNATAEINPQQTPQETLTPTPSVTPTEELEQKNPPEKPPEITKSPTLITILPENKVIQFKGESAQIIDNNIALSPNLKKKNYNLKINETSILNFKLAPVTKDKEVSLSIVHFLPDKTKDILYQSDKGELKEVVLNQGDYVIEVGLMVDNPRTYELIVDQN
jgi:hypothetical protein